jgi:hypothetical protein
MGQRKGREPRFARLWYLPVTARILAHLLLDLEFLTFADFTGAGEPQRASLFRKRAKPLQVLGEAARASTIFPDLLLL